MRAKATVHSSNKPRSIPVAFTSHLSRVRLTEQTPRFSPVPPAAVSSFAAARSDRRRLAGKASTSSGLDGCPLAPSAQKSPSLLTETLPAGSVQSPLYRWYDLDHCPRQPQKIQARRVIIGTRRRQPMPKGQKPPAHGRARQGRTGLALLCQLRAPERG